MKKYALLRLENNANKVIDECLASCVATAATIFNSKHAGGEFLLHYDGYYKTTSGITYCIAEYFNQ